MSDVKIIINGGSNQILPNATEAVQVFCGRELPPGQSTPLSDGDDSETGSDRLSLYVNEENLPHYLAQIGECRSATELAKVIMEMVEREPRVTPDEMVKGRFINLLLPHARRLTKGTTLDNLRKRINDAWARCRKVHL